MIKAWMPLELQQVWYGVLNEPMNMVSDFAASAIVNFLKSCQL